MPNTRSLIRSFAGGEVSPEMWGRVDDVKYQTGAATLRNFVATPQGPAENRAGFAFVREVKYSGKRTRLIPFTFSTSQTMVLELGAGYFRFHTQGATLMNGSVPYEITNPYAETDLFDIHYVQSADVLTLVHPNYAPKELRRYGALDWRLVSIGFSPTILPPASISVSAYVPPSADVNTDTYEDMFYVVCSVAADGITMSESSNEATCNTNIYITGAYNTISWSSVTGASMYYVFKLQAGVFGFIGKTLGTSIVDNNIAPDMGVTPPYYDDIFSSAGNYPGAVSYFEQRRAFAGTLNQPQNIWMTKSGTESNMSFTLPIHDDDRISFKVAAREANTIRHVVPLTQLLLLTGSAEWRVSSVNSDAITPTSISVRPQSYIGASNVQPSIINNSLVYCAARGGHVRECGYNWQANGFITGDLSLRATHLFDGYEIADMSFSKAPQPIVWFVSSTGKLLGLTYIPEQEIGAWHWHDTDGLFESCAVVAEGSEDVLYVVVKRLINGAHVRYVERMASRQIGDLEDCFFVDCGSTYSGTATQTITGLTWLEGKTVSILADGSVHPQRVVTDGSITLDRAYSKVQVGLQYLSDLQSLPIALQIDGLGQGRYKNVNKAWLRVYKSSGIWIGPDADNLVEAKQRSSETYGTPPTLKTDEIMTMLTPTWAASGQVYVRQADPLPLTVASLTLEVSLGG